MPSTNQLFAGFHVSTDDDNVVVKVTGTLYPAIVTDIDVEADTPIMTVYEDGVGVVSGLTFVDCPPEERETYPNLSWFWKLPPR